MRRPIRGPRSWHRDSWLIYPAMVALGLLLMALGYRV